MEHIRVGRLIREITYSRELARALSLCCDWPYDRRAAQKRDDLAPSHGLSPATAGYTLPHHGTRAVLCVTANLGALCRRWVIFDRFHPSTPCRLIPRLRPQ